MYEPPICDSYYNILENETLKTKNDNTVSNKTDREY